MNSFKPKLIIDNCYKQSTWQCLSSLLPPYQSCLSLSPSRANRWDPHLENQPRLRHSSAAVARQRERGRQTVASAGRPQQQQGWRLHLFNTYHRLLSTLGSELQVCSCRAVLADHKQSTHTFHFSTKIKKWLLYEQLTVLFSTHIG